MTTPADNPALAPLLALSRRVGADPRYVIAGGGNTSVKDGDTLHVKASGTSLENADADSFVALDLPALHTVLDRVMPVAGTDEREAAFKDAILAARLHPEKNQRPSVECLLHALLPGRYVVHTHPTWINMALCARNAMGAVPRLFGPDAWYLPYTQPGAVLADRLRSDLTRRAPVDSPTVFLGNHGLIVSGDDSEELLDRTEALGAPVRDRVGAVPEALPGDPPPALADAFAESVCDLMREVFGARCDYQAHAVDTSLAILSLTHRPEGRRLAEAGPLTPDQIVYCRSFPLWLPTDCREADDCRAALEAYRDRHGLPPRIVLAEELGLMAFGASPREAETAAAVYADAAMITHGSAYFGGPRSLDADERSFIENWEVEHYRRQAAANQT